MAKKSDEARARIYSLIEGAFGENHLGTVDKKIIVKAIDDSGEPYQFSITITMPKTPVIPMDNSVSFISVDTKKEEEDKLLWVNEAERETEQVKVKKIMEKFDLF